MNVFNELIESLKSLSDRELALLKVHVPEALCYPEAPMLFSIAMCTRDNFDWEFQPDDDYQAWLVTYDYPPKSVFFDHLGVFHRS